MMITNLFVISNVKQLRIDGSFRIVLRFFSGDRGVLASKIQQFLTGTIRLVWHDFGDPSKFRGGVQPPKTPGMPLYGIKVPTPRVMSDTLTKILM